MKDNTMELPTHTSSPNVLNYWKSSFHPAIYIPFPGDFFSKVDMDSEEKSLAWVHSPVTYRQGTLRDERMEMLIAIV